MNSYDGFIFDYGGVLVRHQTQEEQAQMAEIAGITMDQFQEFYWSGRTDYDKGLLSGIDYWGALGEQAGKLLTLAQIDRLVESDTKSWMNFDEPMWDLVDELRAAGKRVAMLSNMPEDLGEALKARTNRFEKFDFVTLSYEIKSAKPDAPIYEHCLGGLGVAPRRAVFFDDRIANVQGAEMLGMDAVEFVERNAVLARVRS